MTNMLMQEFSQTEVLATGKYFRTYNLKCPGPQREPYMLVSDSFNANGEVSKKIKIAETWTCGTEFERPW